MIAHRPLLALAAVVALSACSAPPPAELPLSPVPYALSVPSEILPRLSTGPIEGPFGEEVAAAGATAATTVYYQPEAGERVIFMTAYWFPAATFEALQQPDQPPLFGFEVLRTADHVLSVAGPKDVIFAPDTPDGRNLLALYGLINLPDTYRPNQ
jgi:hypothetical protein